MFHLSWAALLGHASIFSNALTMLHLSNITTPKPTSDPPEHHVLAASTAHAASGWASYLPSWAPSPKRTRPSLSKSKIAGFRNPWPSWYKPTLAEKWNSFQWGEDDDGCVELAASHLTNDNVSQKPERGKRPRFADIDDWPNSMAAKAARLLRVEKPDFTFPSGSKARVTWLGHAGALVQLSPLDQDSRPVAFLFDPIFSMRCSFTQSAGPVRTYPPPCKAEDLPPIDGVFISHNHLDHMDYDTIMAVWRHNTVTVRFFLPLGNKKWLLDFGIPADRIVEMDWWDSADLTDPSSSPSSGSSTIKVWCTPAQHNSWRSGGDANSALWSSWYLELLSPSNPAYRVFFAGDTGYQFHADPAWPPSPNNPTASSSLSPSPNDNENRVGKEKPPPCPAFSQIRSRIGPPNLLLLPVSVGATFAYFRSFVPLPNAINPFPRHASGVTGANHMPPWDAVRVFRVMTEDSGNGGVGDDMGGGAGDDGGNGAGEGGESEGAVAVAVHWGTFVPEPEDVLKTLGALEWACKSQGARFARLLGETGEQEGAGGDGKPVFVALNHGGSVVL